MGKRQLWFREKEFGVVLCLCGSLSLVSMQNVGDDGLLPGTEDYLPDLSALKTASEC